VERIPRLSSLSSILRPVRLKAIDKIPSGQEILGILSIAGNLEILDHHIVPELSRVHEDGKKIEVPLLSGLNHRGHRNYPSDHYRFLYTPQGRLGVFRS